MDDQHDKTKTFTAKGGGLGGTVVIGEGAKPLPAGSLVSVGPMPKAVSDRVRDILDQRKASASGEAAGWCR